MAIRVQQSHAYIGCSSVSPHLRIPLMLTGQSNTMKTRGGYLQLPAGKAAHGSRSNSQPA